MNIFKFLSPAYRRRREQVLRLRRIRRSRRGLFRQLEVRPYSGHPGEFPNDPFERWMNRLQNGGNIVQLYHEAKHS